MPLIIFTGFPASGKSTRAQQLRDYFSSHVSSKKVTILSENDIAKKKNDVHAGNKYCKYTFNNSSCMCHEDSFFKNALVQNL